MLRVQDGLGGQRQADGQEQAGAEQGGQRPEQRARAPAAGRGGGQEVERAEGAGEDAAGEAGRRQGGPEDAAGEVTRAAALPPALGRQQAQQQEGQREQGEGG